MFTASAYKGEPLQNNDKSIFSVIRNYGCVAFTYAGGAA